MTAAAAVAAARVAVSLEVLGKGCSASGGGAISHKHKSKQPSRAARSGECKDAAAILFEAVAAVAGGFVELALEGA
jgi:hypothetical protein